MKIQDVVDQITTLKAQLLRFGVQAVTSLSRPSAPGLGQVVYEGDTGKLKVWTGTDWNPLSAGGKLGKATTTSTQGSITAEVDLTNLSVTVTVGASRELKITGFVAFQNNTAGAGVIMSIKEGSAYLARAAGANPTAAQEIGLTTIATVTAPTAGSHTYLLRAQTENGGTAQTNATNTVNFILVEDIGPA